MDDLLSKKLYNIIYHSMLCSIISISHISTEMVELQVELTIGILNLIEFNIMGEFIVQAFDHRT